MKKEALSIAIIKILLAILLFTGMGTIIVGGGYIIGGYYKNIISNQVIKPIKEVKWESCVENSDCEARFSHCNCQYHCVDKNMETDDCTVECDEIPIIIPRCVCENNKCVKENFDISDWQTYRNEELGFEFKYPSEFGEIVFEVAPEISLPVEGEKVGMKMEGTFSESSLVFGGKTATYNNVSREITKINFKGYIKNDDGYFFGFNPYQDELYGKMTPKKIINNDVLLVNCESFAKRCLIVNTYMSRTVDEDIKHSMAGLINLKESEFGGLMILANSRYNNKYHKYMDEDRFVEILSTFRFIENSK